MTMSSFDSEPDVFTDTEAAAGVPADRRRRPSDWWVLATIVAVVAVAAYAVGAMRGSAGLDRGVSATTSIVRPVGDTTAGTTEAPRPTGTADPSVGVQVPTVNVVFVGLGDGVPDSVPRATIDTTGSWTGNGSGAHPTSDGPAPADGDRPPSLGEAITMTISPDEAATLVIATLATPTAGSGVALQAVDGTAWQLAIAADLTQLRLYEVRDGVAQQRGYLDATLDGTSALGLFVVDGRVSVMLDGAVQRFQTFFGLDDSTSANGFEGGSPVVVAGAGQPLFTDIAFG